MRMRRIQSAAVLATSSILLAAMSAHAAQRTFVSTSGNDSNPCSLAAPCRAFAAAILQTDPGGEIVVLESGGYGAVTVNKNVTILSPGGVYAGISVFAGDGVLVSAPATNVVLRGLSINGQGGNVGVRVQAGEVHIENCVISNIGGVGGGGILVDGGTTVRISGTVVRGSTQALNVNPTGGAVTVLVRDSEFSNSGQLGIRVSPSGAGNDATVVLERTSVTKSTGYGIYSGPTGGATTTIVVTQSALSEHTIAGVVVASGGATTWVRESAIARNGIGLHRIAGTLNACGANLLAANATATSGTITTASCLDVAAGGGTVISLAQGPGITLAPDPITSTGTIAADTAYLQRRVSGTCGSGSSIRTINADGTVVCEADDVGVGTVTSVGTGTGLTGGPITGAGTVSVAAGGIGNAQLANGSVDLAKLNTASTDARYFKQGGNSFGTSAFLGTDDNQPLALGANAVTSLKLQPTAADPVNTYNTATPNVIGGWDVNAAFVGVIGATIGGGGGDVGGSLVFNRVTDHYGTVGGGAGNTAGDAAGVVRSAVFATVAGGRENTAAGSYSGVASGQQNAANGNVSFVGGGGGNVASASFATVAGGSDGKALGRFSFVGGGWLGEASGVGATVGGGGAVPNGVGGWLGHANVASGDAATISGGFGNAASGAYSTVAGGSYNSAGGDYSVAMGRRAKITHAGAFVFADSQDVDFPSASNDSFRVRATGGGVRFVVAINPDGSVATSCLLNSVSGGWNCSSDRALKQLLHRLDGREVLARLAALPIFAWSPKAAASPVRHYGPTAQDFHAAFGLGDSDLHIGQQDADGVALAAIQGLNAKLEEQLREKNAELAALRDRVARIESLEVEFAALKGALAALAGEKAVVASGR
jgi:hypothetical protein